MKKIITAAAAGLTLLGLAGCGVSANFTVDAAHIAEEAENALAGVVGARPDIDCGTDPIPLVEDSSVVCELTDPGTGALFDVTITFTEVEIEDGNQVRYNFHTKVADQPKA